MLSLAFAIVLALGFALIGPAIGILFLEFTPPPEGDQKHGS